MRIYLLFLVMVGSVCSSSSFNSRLSSIKSKLHLLKQKANQVDFSNEKSMFEHKLHSVQGPNQLRIDGQSLFDKGLYSKAYPLFLKAAEMGDVESMAQVGKMLFKGNGVDRDRSLALYWFKNAAEKAIMRQNTILVPCTILAMNSKKITKKPNNGSNLQLPKVTQEPAIIWEYSTKMARALKRI